MNTQLKNDIKQIREENNIRKKELRNILNISDDNNYTLLELRSKFFEKKRVEEREKDRQRKIIYLGLDLGVDLHSTITNDELEIMYNHKFELRKRLNEETEKFYNSIRYDKQKEEPKKNNTLTGIYNDNLLYNPGGAIIYTQSNASNQMVYNAIKEIYEPQPHCNY